jgi:hypothetical protein
MTGAAIRDMVINMKLAIIASVFALLASPAWATDLDLGFARPGMTADEFRAHTWPDGVTVRCSGEDDLPPESETVRLSVPRPVARLGGTRCGLFTRDGGGWRTYELDVAGNGAEVWGKFFPDRDGTLRLVQFLIKQPPQAFDTLADFFTDRFGSPQSRAAGLARWETDSAEATIIEDGGRTLLAFIIDTRLQAALNTRMSHQPRRPAGKEQQK